ncbi:MIP/aquaporin family protein [Capillimicrobium parvum]|uniref:Glycerol uptake facilitator protein n=1 Tax=Capillimicrobium parvum TaxID=2884022 RepID=A0A9E6XWK6_9ACTN|nr:aquaporin [Capillimicrobium parvum]UGS35470.1 Glycerol uptake facilitator protein [Capillimicrobium parvum]
MEQRGVSAFIAEFVGTFFLVLFICMAVSVTAPTGLTVPALLVIALTHAIVLAMAIYALGETSGGHFNPAVTTTLMVLRKISPPNAAVYIVLQFAAAVCAALVCKLLIGNFGKAANYGAPALSPIANGKGGGFLAEMIGVFVLLWAIMAMAVNVRAPKGWAGLIIGLTLGLGVLGFGALTGSALNPARAFGPALVSGSWGPAGTWLLVYVLAPLVGGVLAGIGYTKLVLDEQEKRWGGRLVDTDVPPGQLPDSLAAAEEGPGERPIDKLS